ncbi:TetR/AcrR family transcriptional regulator [Fuscovulum blasticum]|uniref:TetR/AcrR family transcriptional regulator n=1 Tax=Fuscovulum blasticum TaxID=1075 RepID=UPI000D3EC32A|nr:TetR/AcrR family transcriptional regulator [Fuscovulum blasticum]AWD20246.1 hypothetical protein B6K69_00070 [Fuscovulum blasticum]
MTRDPAEKTRVRLTPDARRAALEEAACACIARGGIRAFTVDKVMAEAGVSRGLILHHFGSMDGLLVAVYTRMYRDSIAALAVPRPGLSPLEALIEALLTPPQFDRAVQGIWLTLWGEVATNPVLTAAHRALYGEYRATVAAALRDEAARNGRTIDAEALAAAFICLMDGIGVQLCVEPQLMTAAMARAACRALLSPHLGPVTAAG